MKKTLILFINIFLVLLVVACKKTEPTPTPEPKPEEKVYFTVEFDVNEGDVSIASQRVLENSYATLPTERPNKEGYSFSGWTITLDGEDYFDFTETKIAGFFMSFNRIFLEEWYNLCFNIFKLINFEGYSFFILSFLYSTTSQIFH